MFRSLHKIYSRFDPLRVTVLIGIPVALFAFWFAVVMFIVRRFHL